jgi:hypothetical protein
MISDVRKNYAQCMSDRELIQELKSRAADQRIEAERAVRDDLHCNPSAGSTHEDLAALMDECAMRIDKRGMMINDARQSHASAVKHDLWESDPYAGPQGESICGEGVKLEVWCRGDWSVTWFGNDPVFGREESRESAKKAAVAKFKTLFGRLQMQYKQANSLDDRL